MRDSDRSNLFARARSEATPTDEDRRRVRAGIARKLGASAGVAVATTAAKSAASVVANVASVTGSAGATAAGVSGLVMAKVAIAIVATVAVVSLALPARHASPSPGRTGSVTAIPTTPRPLPPVVNPSEPEQPVPPAAQALATPPRTTHAEGSAGAARAAPLAVAQVSPPVIASAAPVNDAAEVELVARMQAALRSGDTTAVLELVREHERLFPGSALTPERDGARVLAMCMRSEPREARPLGQAFLDTHPRSPLSGRVRATCGLDTAAVTPR